MHLTKSVLSQTKTFLLLLAHRGRKIKHEPSKIIEAMELVKFFALAPMSREREREGDVCFLRLRWISSRNSAGFVVILFTKMNHKQTTEIFLPFLLEKNKTFRPIDCSTFSWKLIKSPNTYEACDGPSRNCPLFDKSYANCRLHVVANPNIPDVHRAMRSCSRGHSDNM